VAAYAASAFATTSEAALLDGKPGLGAARDSGADSPFAAMLAEMAGGTIPQAMSTTNAAPANEVQAAAQSTTPLATRDFATSDRLTRSGSASGLPQTEMWTPEAAWHPQSAATSAARFNATAQEFTSAAPPAPGARIGSADSFAELLANTANTTRPLPASQQGASNAAEPASSTPFAASFAQPRAVSDAEQPRIPAGAQLSGANDAAVTPHALVLAQASTAQSSAMATFLAGGSAPQSAAQQAASTWLQQIMGTGATNPASQATTQGLPANFTNTAQQAAATSAFARAPVEATGANAQTFAQDVPSWLQQAMAARSPAAASQAPATLLFGVSSSAQPAGTAAINAVAQSAAQTPSSLLQQIIAASVQAGASPSTAAPQNALQNLPSGVASYAQSLTTLNSQFAVTTVPPLPTTPAQSTGANAQPSTQEAPSWLQPAMATVNSAAPSVAQLQSHVPANLPFGVPSYAQAAVAAPLNTFASPQAGPQQKPSPLVQQIIAASEQTGSSASATASQSERATLPSGVASYEQSMKAVAAPFAGAPSATADAQPSHILQAAPGMSAAASASTILAAGSTQSVAAMFGVPSFPSAMAFAASGSDTLQPAEAGNASAAATQPASVAGHAANGGPSAAASATANMPAVPQAPQQLAQQGAAQSFHALASANQTPAQAAVADSNKAVTLAQAAQTSVRQGHAPAVTEAQALPLPFDPSEAKDAPPANVARMADSGASAAEQQTADASGSSSQVSQPAPPAPLQHVVSPPPPAPSLPASAANAPQAPLPATAAAQLPTGTPAQPTQAAAALPSAPPAATLATPDLNALAVSIATKSLSGAQQFDIRMDPAELGRVDVRLSLDGNGTAQAHLAAERPETLTLLQNNAATLTRALQDSGVQVANNGLQFSLKGQERQGDGQPRASSRGRGSAAQNITAAGAVSAATPAYCLSPSGSGVNILV
jgi:flagellar hook-length control protein FliK